jgi:dihydroorotase
MKTLIKDATIINEGLKHTGSVLINDERIEKIYPHVLPHDFDYLNVEIINAKGLYLIPGVIDDQVHFREPGLTHKGEIATESKAAVAGGVTTYMEMPNTIPQAVTQELLEDKYKRASQVSAANYSFYMGTTNTNLEEVLKTDPSKVCGIKIFMGSSTGNMLVDDEETLSEVFKNAPTLIATHCEDEATIQKNIEIARKRYGEQVPISRHAHIRSDEACYISSSKAVNLAAKHDTRLHVLHLTSEKEMSLFNSGNVKDKNITAEVCVHHLWFDERDYIKYGTRIKWNPAIKCVKDKEALWDALLSDKIDVIATDHAPHHLDDKRVEYPLAANGISGFETAFSLCYTFLVDENIISLSRLIELMSYSPLDILGIKNHSIKTGDSANITIAKLDERYEINTDNFVSKGKNNPFDKWSVTGKIFGTIVDGKPVVWEGKLVDK